MPRTYVFTIFLSFIAGLITTFLIMSEQYLLLLILLSFLFVIVLLNEKTAFLENMLSRRVRECMTLYLLVLLLLFVMILAIASMVGR